MKEAIEKAFGIVPVEIKRLNGYENENFLIATGDEYYVFKTYPVCKKTSEILEAECTLLLFLQQPGPINTPIPIPFKKGGYVKPLKINGALKACRLLSFLPGKFLAETTATESLMENMGRFLARINLRLTHFESATVRARQYEWDIQNLLLNRKHIKNIPKPSNRRVVTYFFRQFEALVLPKIPALRKAYIHSDFNEWNVLSEGEKTTGLIDFGDVVYSPLVNDVATALTYLTYDKSSFFEWATPFLKSYHKTLPLKQEEVSLLYYLIASKLCISVCHSARAAISDPKNKYASVSETNALSMLHRLLKMNPIAVENHFLKALGFSVKTPASIEQKYKDRQVYIGKALSVSYQKPIYTVQSIFQHIYDGYGGTFLDAYNNIPHVGHSHPKVVEAGQRQMAQLNTNTRYLYDLLPEYAEQLLSRFPSRLNKVFFVNSGSEASDLAIRIAKKHTGNKNVMVVEHGYHGHTQAGIDISDYKFNNSRGQGQKDYIIKAALPKTYQGKHGEGAAAGALYAKEAVELLRAKEGGLAAFIAEPIVGCGGQVPLAPSYLKAIYPEIRKRGGVCISDEVQTGFGRLGDCFWGYEQHGVVPDIVVVGKPMGNGHPMGAVITTSNIADSFAEGVEFFSSFGGNPVSCSIGKAVLDVINEEGLQENAIEVGSYYKMLFNQLKEKHNCIGNVRGSGLFLGVEIINNQGGANKSLAQHLKNELRQQYILIGTDGPENNVIKTKPPMLFTKKNALTVVEAIDRLLQ